MNANIKQLAIIANEQIGSSIDLNDEKVVGFLSNFASLVGEKINEKLGNELSDCENPGGYQESSWYERCAAQADAYRVSIGIVKFVTN